LQLKLDELIRVTKGAHNLMLDLESMDDEQLARLREIYESLASKARGDDQQHQPENNRKAVTGPAHST
jgi:low affinity Fe/Cu permease